MRLFISILFILTSLSVFGQGSVEIYQVPQSEPEVNEAETPVAVDPDSDEALINELEQQRIDRAKKYEEIGTIVPDEMFDPMAELKKLGHENITPEIFLDEKVIPIFTRVFKENHLKDLPRDQVRATIMEKFQGHPLERFFKRFPRVLEVFVDLLRDPDAFPSLLQIFKRKQDLKNYGLILLGVMIALFFFKRKFIPKTIPFYKRIPLSILVSLGFLIFSFGFFYYTFKAETGPAVKVILSHIL